MNCVIMYHNTAHRMLSNLNGLECSVVCRHEYPDEMYRNRFRTNSTLLWDTNNDIHTWDSDTLCR